MDSQVDVSVAMMTYYHESYVGRAIESVLAQDTSYTYEIVISDDCSQDGTRKILKEYQSKYPDIIRLNFNEKNLGISNNNYQTRLLCRGRYIATLSGDDYWIDKRKIQKQVEFLDNHLDYYAAATCIEGRFDNDNEAFAIYPKKKYRGVTIDLKMYLKGAMFGTNGMMMRNAYLTEEGRQYFSLVPQASRFIDDATENILVLQKGKVYVSEDRAVVYHVNRDTTGKHNFNSIHTTFEKCKKSIDLYNYLYDNMTNCPDLICFYKDHIAIAMAQTILTRNVDQFKNLYSGVPKEYKRRGLVIRTIPRMIHMSFTKIKNTILSK